MTNSPIEQPMSNTELRALVASNASAVAELRESTASTNQSVQALRGEIAAGFDRVQQQIDSAAKAVQALGDERTEREALAERRTAEHLDRMDAAERQITMLAELTATAYQREQLRDGRIDRLEAEREPRLRDMLQQILERVNQIWGRLNA